MGSGSVSTCRVRETHQTPMEGCVSHTLRSKWTHYRMMRSLPRWTLAVVAAVFFSLTSNLTTSAQDSVPGWHTNLDQARRLAEENGKPLFIVFRCVR